MATIAQTRSTAIAHNGGFLSRIVSGLTERYARYTTYRKCMDELSSLSNRELRDLGLNRSMIRSLAYEEAYRSM